MRNHATARREPEGWGTRRERLAWEDGFAHGFAQGLAQGRELARQGWSRVLLEVLGSRFGGVPAEVEARVLASEFGEVRTWLVRLCRAETLMDVFADE